MRLLKAIGVYFLTLLPFAFFDWGPYTWIPGLVALVVAIFYYRRRPSVRTSEQGAGWMSDET